MQSFQHSINKLDFGLLVNLNIISNHSKYPFQRSKGLPKTVRWQAEQVQIRVQSAGGHKATPLAFNYLTIYIVMFQRKQTIEQPNCINFHQLICLTLVFDHNILIKPNLSTAISRHVHLHLFKKAYIANQSPYKLREMRAI